MCASSRAGEGRPQAACAEQWPADRCDKRLHVHAHIITAGRSSQSPACGGWRKLAANCWSRRRATDKKKLTQSRH